MRSLRQLLAVILLALALGTPVYAGDMQGPPGPEPPPVAAGSPLAPASNASDLQASTVSDDFIDTTTIAFDLLYGLLSMF